MISTTGEYALRAAVYLALHYGSPKTTAEIAEATQVPAGYLSKIMQALVKHELVTSQRGLGGGFHLTRDPEDITVLDVLCTIDSSIQRIRHCPLGLKTHTKLCPLHRLVDSAIALVEESFRSATLSSLLKSGKELKPLCEITQEMLLAAARPKKA